MKLYHVTPSTHAVLILRTGFKNSEKVLGETEDGEVLVVRGAWFSDQPTFEGGYGDPPKDWEILSVEIPDDLLGQYEVINEGCPYREWCIPSDLVNRFFDHC